jgi:pyruvate formate lyase activating enzyme
LKEALFWQREKDCIRCLLCPHACLLAPGQRGICRGREHRQERLVATTFGRITSCAVDPIEKKPLYHFLPGTKVLSVGTVGCNLSCSFCQNWQISQQDAPTQSLEPGELVELATKLQGQDPSMVGIAYTYSEPLIWYEYIQEAAKLAHQKGLYNVVVSNGFINPEPLKALLPLLDAANIDLKAFSNTFYRRWCKGAAAPPRQSAKLLKESCHLELTCLLIPGANDSPEEISQLVDWIADNLGQDVPLHLSRYFPSFKMDRPPTPIETMTRALEIAKGKLNYVYLGNVEAAPDTDCPFCGARVISRRGKVKIELEGRACPSCRELLPIFLEA